MEQVVDIELELVERLVYMPVVVVEEVEMGVTVVVVVDKSIVVLEPGVEIEQALVGVVVVEHVVVVEVLVVHLHIHHLGHRKRL